MWVETPRNLRVLVVGLGLLLMALAANVAWLNPLQPYSTLYKTSERFPIFWQYNADAGLEVMTAAYFPEYFRKFDLRINRPVFPAAAKGLGLAVDAVLPGIELSPVQRAGVGYVLVKTIFVLVSALAFLSILRRYLDPPLIVLALGLMLFHQYTVIVTSFFHTGDAHYLSPILIAWMLLSLADRFTWPRLVLFSLAVGVLMLVRTNYAAYLAVLAFALLHRRWFSVAASFVVHLVPLGLWLAFIYSIGLKYASQEVTAVGMGVTFFNAVATGDVAALIGLLVTNAYRWGVLFLVEQFHGLLFFAAVGLWAFRSHRQELSFIALLFLTTYLQAAVSGFPRTGEDVAFVIFGLAALGAGSIFRSLNDLRRVAAVLTVWTVANIFLLVQWPWVHPYDQEGRDYGGKEAEFEGQYLDVR